jgi:hypothetical protein
MLKEMPQLSFIKSIYKLARLTNKWYLGKLYVKKAICFTAALLRLLILLECNLELLTQRVQTLGQKKCSLFRDKPLGVQIYDIDRKRSEIEKQRNLWQQTDR